MDEEPSAVSIPCYFYAQHGRDRSKVLHFKHVAKLPLDCGDFVVLVPTDEEVVHVESNDHQA